MSPYMYIGIAGVVVFIVVIVIISVVVVNISQKKKGELSADADKDMQLVDSEETYDVKTGKKDPLKNVRLNGVGSQVFSFDADIEIIEVVGADEPSCDTPATTTTEFEFSKFPDSDANLHYGNS